MTLTALLVYGALSVGILGWWLARGGLGVLAARPESALGRLGLAHHWTASIGVGVLLGLAVVEFTRRVLSRFAWARFLEGQLRLVLEGLTAGQAIAIALASGVGEELLFRGVLQTWLGARFGPGVGLVGSSLLFGLAHLGPGRGFLGWGVFSLVMGLVLGGLFLATGSLLVPIAMHVTINGLNLLLEVWERRLDPPPLPTPGVVPQGSDG